LACALQRRLGYSQNVGLWGLGHSKSKGEGGEGGEGEGEVE